MGKRMPCPHCGISTVFTIEDRREKVTIKGREVAFISRVSRCEKCGEELETPGQLDENLDAAREAYARKYETASPEALVDLRARYNSGQKAFGQILGFGELTMNSYEQGTVPDSTNRLLLALAENPLIFKAMYNINKLRIGAIQRERIESSDAFKSTGAWKGLEALAVELSDRQRKFVEESAERAGRSVVEQVAAQMNIAAVEAAHR